MLLTDEFEQRGRAGYYYRRGRHSAAYVLRPCEGCGLPCLSQVGVSADWGRFCTKRCAMLAERGPNWQGDAARYAAAHSRVYRARGKATSCVWGCEASRYHWANLTGNLLDPDDYAPMCVRCHHRYDGAVKATAARPAGWDWRPWRSQWRR